MAQASARHPLYLEDLSVGQVLRSDGDGGAVTTEAIKRYAREFDPQPFHLDEDAAAKTMFGGLAASGWHTAALTMQLLVGNGLPLAGGIIGAGLDELKWPRPVRPGDRLHTESEVLEVRPSKSRPEQGLAKIRTTTFNQNNEPVQIFTGNLIVPRRVGAATAT
jgi:acyl dehydratase